MNAFHSCDGTAIFIRLKMKCSILAYDKCRLSVYGNKSHIIFYDIMK